MVTAPDQAVRWRIRWLTGVATIAIGVTSSSQALDGQVDPAESAEVVIVAWGPDVCLDCIELRPVVLLGEEDGPGYLIPHGSVVRDTLGRYWALQRDGIKVYDRSGDFLQSVGRPGEGPLEFKDIGSANVDRRGLVHLYDMGNLRESVLGLDFALRGEHRTPGIVISAEPLPGGEQRVANMIVSSPEQVGISLHVVNDDWSIASSFGVSAMRTRRTVTQFRVAVDQSGNIFAGHTSRYVIDQWSSDGLTHLLRLERSVDWEEPPISRGRASRRGSDLYGQLVALRADGANRLWVAAWVPREDWREHVTQIPRGDGAPTFQWNEPSDVYRSVIELIDLENGTLIAQADLGGALIYGFLDDQMVYGPAYGNDGSYQVEISTIHFSPRLRGRR